MAAEHSYSLTDFTSHAQEHLARLRATGQPETLIDSDGSEVIVQDAKAYQQLLDRLDSLEAVAAVRESMAEYDRGEGRPLSKHWLYWSTGNSPRVNTILDHMTPEERRSALLYGGLAGGVLGVASAGLSLLIRYLILDLQAGMPAILAATAIGGAVLCALLYLVQRMSTNFLKSTAWSKARGWDRDPLPLKVWHRK